MPKEQTATQVVPTNTNLTCLHSSNLEQTVAILEVGLQIHQDRIGTNLVELDNLDLWVDLTERFYNERAFLFKLLQNVLALQENNVDFYSETRELLLSSDICECEATLIDLGFYFISDIEQSISNLRGYDKANYVNYKHQVETVFSELISYVSSIIKE